MVKFFTDKANPQALKCIITSVIVGIQLEIVDVNLEERANRTDEFIAMSPLGKTPVLEMDRGNPLFDSNAICRYLSSKQKKVVLIPSGTDGFKVDQWLEWEDSVFTPESFYYFANLAGVAGFIDEKISNSETKTKQNLSYLENSIRPNSKYLVGDSLTLADIAVWSSLYLLFANGGIFNDSIRSNYPNIQNWFNSLAQEKHIINGVKKAGLENGADLVVAAFVSKAESVDEGNRVYKLSPKPNKPIYITTPIYYVNSSPHIGHVFTTLLSDVIARWYRLRGFQVFFMTGTDEHGQKVAQSAELKGITPKEFTDLISNEFKTMFEKFNFQYDRFIRTTDSDHEKAVLEMWKRLKDNGYIYLGYHEGWYCVSDETFVTELQIDEVEREGKKIKISKESGHPVEWVREENYKFKLSAFEKPLLEWLSKNPNAICPRFRQKEIENFIRGGLQDLSISRTRITWGIDVPKDEKNPTKDNHVIYVWLDALTNYLTSAGFPANEGSPCWPADFHLMGKDIIKFHAIYWPAFLLAAGLPLPKKIVAHGWWTKNSQKISKSLGNAFDPLDVANEYSLDALRYFLCRESNNSIDGDYTDSAMVAHLNSDLADDFGNLVLRCASPALLPERLVPACGELQEVDKKLISQVENLPGFVDYHISQVELQKALVGIWDVLGLINKYATSTQPWTLKKTDPTRMQTVMYVMIECVRICTIVISPFMPDTCKKVFDLLGIPEDLRDGNSFKFGAVKAGTPIPNDKVILFTKKEQEKNTQDASKGKPQKQQQPKEPKQPKAKANNNNNNSNAN